MNAERSIRRQIEQGIEMIDTCLQEVSGYLAQDDYWTAEEYFGDACRGSGLINDHLPSLDILPCRSQYSYEVEFRARISQIAYHHVAAQICAYSARLYASQGKDGSQYIHSANYHLGMMDTYRGDANVAIARAHSF
jgi:hypothetical protein